MAISPVTSACDSFAAMARLCFFALLSLLLLPGPDGARAQDRPALFFRATLIDGTEFDSSYNRGEPVSFQVNQVIPGWTEALKLMKEGGKWKLYIPSDLAYGPRGRPGIPPNSVLVFEVELLKVL